MGAWGMRFRGRFKAIVVDRDSYLLELCRYVVGNPIRAGMVAQIEHYAWSSYPATLGLSGCPDWLETDWLLGQFAKTRTAARRRYAEFVAQGKGLPPPWPAVRGQALLGSEAFVEKMRPLLECAYDLKEIPRTQRLLHRPSLERIFAIAVQEDKDLAKNNIPKSATSGGGPIVPAWQLFIKDDAHVFQEV